MNIKRMGIGLGPAGFGAKRSGKESISERALSRGGADRLWSLFGRGGVDYPDFAHKLGKAIEEGQVDYGVALMAPANGISIVLNKYPHVRAALSWKPELAQLARLRPTTPM